MRDTKRKGAKIEDLFSRHFNTEIRFDKSTGLFSVEMPVGEEPITGTEIEKVRRAAKEKLRDWIPAGEWKRKIYVTVTGEQADKRDPHSPWHRHSRGPLSWNPQTLSVGTCEIELLEANGKRIVRTVGSNSRGEDGKWALQETDDAGEGSYLIDWTPERAQALLDIQAAMQRLTERLRTLVATPELIASAMRELGAGGDE